MLGGALISLIGAVLMFPYPRQLSGATVAQIQRTWLVMLRGEKMVQAKPAKQRTWMSKLKKLVRNRVFQGAHMEEFARAFVVAGFSVFMASHLRLMFTVTYSEADNYAAVIVAAAVLGLCYGTFIQYGLRLDVVGNVRLSFVGAVGALIGCAVFLVTCPVPRLAGVSVPYPDGSMDLINDCNRNCSCENRTSLTCFDLFNNSASNTSTFHQRVMFLSPCHAGCVDRNLTDCSCLNPFSGIRRKERCDRCAKYRAYSFLVGISWAAGCLFMRSNAAQQLQLRGVHFSLRVTSLAVSAVFTKLAAIISILLYTVFQRMNCQVDNRHCGQHVYCAWLNRLNFGLTMTIAIAAGNLMCVIGMLVPLVGRQDAPATVEQWFESETSGASGKHPPISLKLPRACSKSTDTKSKSKSKSRQADGKELEELLAKKACPVKSKKGLKQKSPPGSKSPLSA